MTARKPLLPICERCQKEVPLHMLCIVRTADRAHVVHQFCTACRDQWEYQEGMREDYALRLQDIREAGTRAGVCCCCGNYQRRMHRGLCSGCYDRERREEAACAT